MKRKIFVDTSEFIANNFNFGNKNFQSLRKRAEYGQVQIGLPSITKNEIENQIRERVTSAIESLKKQRTRIQILQNLEDDRFRILFEELQESVLSQKLFDKLRDYLRLCDVKDISIAGLDIQGVFELYFHTLPPFKDGKKKSEFPDAFVLSALDRWGQIEGSEVWVASSDTDMREGCESFPHLKYIGSLSKLLSKLSNEFDTFLSSQAQIACRVLKEDVENRLVQRFERQERNDGYYSGLEDGRGSAIKVENVASDFSLIEVSENFEGMGKAVFEVVGTFYFWISVSASEDLQIYSSDDQLYYVLSPVEESFLVESSNESVEEEHSFRAFLTIEFEIKDPETSEVIELEMMSGRKADRPKVKIKKMRDGFSF